MFVVVICAYHEHYGDVHEQPNGDDEIGRTESVQLVTDDRILDCGNRVEVCVQSVV